MGCTGAAWHNNIIDYLTMYAFSSAMWSITGEAILENPRLHNDYPHHQCHAVDESRAGSVLPPFYSAPTAFGINRCHRRSGNSL